ncbi:hypothetical protein N5S72_10620 [Aliarcobacter cryaerophilus]|uniref:hypothetical protein n=1 Tax=Aliarcobacter cryaerophilus TaxID=28198 RepID=UPI0021B44C7F|nr:hypothetical protein [Aliarcobacter cryaerophilus]MCT7464901.1 hypothetical protein [Aliarcobacter cryaerophilus]
MNINSKIILSSIGLALIILIFWKLTYHVGCIAFLIPIFITLILASSYIDMKLKQKECFKNCYVNDNTFIAKFLTSPYLTSIFFIVLSIIYTINLMHDILNFSIGFYFVLIILIFITFHIYNFFLKFFKNHINDKHIEIFAREATSKISAIILFIIYIIFYLNSYDPDYLRESLNETVTLASNSISSQCYLIDFILKIKREYESIILFGMNSIDNNFKEEAWVIFIIFHGLSILGLNRLLIQIIYLMNILFKRDMNGEN